MKKLEPGCYADSWRGYNEQCKIIGLLCIDLGGPTVGQNLVNYAEQQKNIPESALELDEAMETACTWLDRFAPADCFVGWQNGDFGVWKIED